MNTGQSGIIYASTRKEVERIYHLLESKNCSWDVSWGMSVYFRTSYGAMRFVIKEILNLITKKRAELVVTVYLVMLC